MKNGYNYKWIGTNTNKNITWESFGDTYKEIFDDLVDRNIIGGVDALPLDIQYILDTLGKNIDDFSDDYEIFFDEIYAAGADILTDESYKEIILMANGNAYYQDFI